MERFIIIHEYQINFYLLLSLRGIIFSLPVVRNYSF